MDPSRSPPHIIIFNRHSLDHHLKQRLEDIGENNNQIGFQLQIDFLNQKIRETFQPIQYMNIDFR